MLATTPAMAQTAETTAAAKRYVDAVPSQKMVDEMLDQFKSNDQINLTESDIAAIRGAVNAANLDAVIATLACLSRRQGQTPIQHPRADLFYKGEWNLDRQTKLLFGPCPPARRARIMVTLDAACASEFDLVKSLLAAGMDVARINCAHDDRETWAAALADLRRREKAATRELDAVAAQRRRLPMVEMDD